MVTKINFSWEEKAKVFNYFFLSNATLNDNNIRPSEISVPSNEASLSQISTSEKDILDILRTLDVNKAAETATSITKPLTRIFHLCASSSPIIGNYLICYHYTSKTKKPPTTTCSGPYIFSVLSAMSRNELFSSISLIIQETNSYPCATVSTIYGFSMHVYELTVP